MDRIHPASFRDPAGFVYLGGEGQILRQLNAPYRLHYEKFITSGLYEALAAQGSIIRHTQRADLRPLTPAGFTVLEAEKLPFISYPYEWSLSQLKDAALLTLDIQEQSLEKGMSLKDCSAYNVQFQGSKAVFIDLPSFEIYRPDSPWVAYRQFCQHFVAPLLMASRVDLGLLDLLRVQTEGISLALASRLLPRTSWLNPRVLMHLHLHARLQEACASHRGTRKIEVTKVSYSGLRGMIESLRSLIESIPSPRRPTEWSSYYQEHSYSPGAFEVKRRAVAGFLDGIAPGVVWDLGANTGEFAELCSKSMAYVVAVDIDPLCVDTFYLKCRSTGTTKILPLRMDLANPSPSLGWAHEERSSLGARGPADCVLALALTHHLAVSGNIPFPRQARCFSRLARELIIEFVPKEDPQTQRLLVSREDVFPGYRRDDFESSFREFFDILREVEIPDCSRVLYWMKLRAPQTHGMGT